MGVCWRIRWESTRTTKEKSRQIAKLTTGQKALRVLQFIMGLRQARTAEALAAYGHTQENLDEGFNLMRDVTARAWR